VLFDDIGETAILGILVGGTALAIVTSLAIKLIDRRRGALANQPIDRAGQMAWQMPPLAQLAPARMTLLGKVWMVVLRGYLAIAAGMVLIRIIRLAVIGQA
jgi:hypothetical protein